jgi:hypothetical protein
VQQWFRLADCAVVVVEFRHLLLMQAAVATGFCFIVVLFFRDKPPTLPSAGAVEISSESIFDNFRRIFTQPSFLVLLLGWSIAYACASLLQ